MTQFSDHSDTIINQTRYPINQTEYRNKCKRELDEQGALVLPEFLTKGAIEKIATEGTRYRHLAFYTVSDHNIYLNASDPAFDTTHQRAS